MEPLRATINTTNYGTNSILQPLAIAPGSSSSSDAGPFTVAVSLLVNPGSARQHSVLLGNAVVPGVNQNSNSTFTSNFVLPSRPAGFPSYGGKLYLQLAVLSGDAVGSTYVDRQDPIKIVTPAAAVKVVGVDLPQLMQPGDTIAPNIRLANYGSVNTAVGGPLTVELVASTSKTFNSGVSVVAKYNVQEIQPQSLVPTQNLVLGDVNLDPPTNFETLFGTPVTLPVSPRKYYLGVVVNPTEQAGALAQVGKVLLLGQVKKVGPPIKNLPPAGVIGQGVTPFPSPFPYPNAPTLNNS